MGVNVKLLAKSMIEAVRGELKAGWAEVSAVAEVQLRALAQSAGDIEQLVRRGSIDEERARLLFEMNRNAARSVLLTIEGIGVITAEDVIKTALRMLPRALGRLLGAAPIAVELPGSTPASFKAGRDLGADESET